MILEIETSQVGGGGGVARSAIDFALSPTFLSEEMSLVPTWKII